MTDPGQTRISRGANWPVAELPPSSAGDRHQGARVFGSPLGPRRRGILRPQNELLCTVPLDRLFHLETAARHRNFPLAGGGVRGGGRVCKRLPIGPCPHRNIRLHRGTHGAPFADRALAGSGDRIRRQSLDKGRGPNGFIRFSGELFIYLWLLPAEPWVAPWWDHDWWRPNESVIENMAPVLTRLFTPLLATVLIVFLGTVLFTKSVVDIDRELLIAFDLLLAVVLSLLLYSVSSRDPRSAPSAFDVVQVVLVARALLANAVALWAIAARITEFGFRPNRVAALGENVVLLVNLA